MNFLKLSLEKVTPATNVKIKKKKSGQGSFVA
jgi:hypothetical protein